jgi:pyruvate/2-oxoglutarate dehydrogenase complex dihydrolipoamide acyltransferase (E2) component
MGFDNQSAEFHEALKKLVRDPEPLVRRNAALALVRFNDNSGSRELVEILRLYHVRAPAGGIITSTLREGAEVARGTLLARIQQSEGKVLEVRSPLPGRINQIVKANGAQVSADDEVLNLNSDEASVWEALRALTFVGSKEDLAIVQQHAYASDSRRVREQASLTAKAIEARTKALMQN